MRHSFSSPSPRLRSAQQIVPQGAAAHGRERTMRKMGRADTSDSVNGRRSCSLVDAAAPCSQERPPVRLQLLDAGQLHLRVAVSFQARLSFARPHFRREGLRSFFLAYFLSESAASLIVRPVENRPRPSLRETGAILRRE